MTWTNAFDIGACTVNVYLYPSYPPTMPPATSTELLAAGLTLSTTGGIVTLTWDGVTGSYPSAFVDVVPGYPLNGMAAQLVVTTVQAPAVGASMVLDGVNIGDPVTGSLYGAYSPIPTPWAYPSAPVSAFGAATFYGS